MSSGRYKIDRFFGIDQSVEENFLSNGYTADACNMNTDDGNLSVAKGFVRIGKLPVPDEETIHRCTVFRHKDGDIYLAFAGNSIYLSYGTVWLKVYEYKTVLEQHDFAFLEAKIGNTDYMIIGNGETGLIKFDGNHFTDFGSSERNSDHPVRYLAMYKGRLFSAGDKNNPNRLYWSQLPGDDRSIEDWGEYPASVNVEGGHVQIGSFDNDPIVAITALSSQLLIFKKNSMYRLYGDKPSNFTVEEIESVIESTAHTSIIHYGDIAYFMTATGLYVFDGVSAHLTQDALCIRKIMDCADVSRARGARTREKLYYTVKIGEEDAVIEYNLKRQTYMLRKGFEVCDIFARDNRIYLMSDRYVCLFDEGDTYAGAPIAAHWQTPLTDLGEKSVIKTLHELYLRGDMQKNGTLHLETETGGVTREYSIRLIDDEVTEVPLRDEGRCFCLRFSNEAGKSFSLRGGIELSLFIRGRCI